MGFTPVCVNLQVNLALRRISEVWPCRVSLGPTVLWHDLAFAPQDLVNKGFGDYAGLCMQAFYPKRA